ncbi:hypothetical protein K8Z61_10310 [Nocardioides sp. TRM66260-LWL]|uniref:hypothetical protein n=1 Tax=Nocardioides sp. TRM66260-LWL TaxID=2874478 RepID=UPI001CC6216C|nr:hypothetical protein [Nocardioides sp. TRM66260-LWL]MBZ5734888.1 hypothetical protein [Nocardioides sp. TRM66260-LWL]
MKKILAALSVVLMLVAGVFATAGTATAADPYPGPGAKTELFLKPLSSPKPGKAFRIGASVIARAASPSRPNGVLTVSVVRDGAKAKASATSFSGRVVIRQGRGYIRVPALASGSYTVRATFSPSNKTRYQRASAALVIRVSR